MDFPGFPYSIKPSVYELRYAYVNDDILIHFFDSHKWTSTTR